MKWTGRILVIIAVLVATIAAVTGNLTVSIGESDPPTVAMASEADHASSGAETQAGQALNPFTQIYNDVSPSVVAISVSAESRGRTIPMGTGSGFVVDTVGHIVTNYHVVEGANQIEVDFYDGTLSWAEVVGLDPDSDLAVLKVDVPADTLRPVAFGDSSALQVGETVLAIGSPFGNDWTLTSGIVSGLERRIQGMSQFSIGGVIQTDAAINPGNSGGPLLNMQGQVVGVNAQIATATTANSGVGFAIPGNLARQVVESLISRGSVSYSYLGISGTDLTLSIIDAFGLPNDTRGVVVAEVVRDSPADRAGLRADTTVDIITAVNGNPLKTMDELISYLARETVPGQTIRLSVLRDGRETVEMDVALTARP